MVSRTHRVLLAATVVGVEIATIVVVQTLSEFGCTREADPQTCGFFAQMLFRGAVLWSLCMLYLLLRGRRVLAGGLGCDQVQAWPWPWAPLQLLGFGLILSPLLPGGPSFSGAASALFAWSAGCLLAGIGTLFWLMPRAQWMALFRKDGLVIALVAAAGFAAPDIVTEADRAWAWSGLTYMTFASVAWILSAFGDVYADPAGYVIGLDGFLVWVGQACSGIQGLALIAVFLTLYFLLQRKELNFRRAWVLVPIALASSFALNVVRIAVLILVGASGSPELAVGGFHSHAGWLLFTVLAFALVGVSRRLAWFQAEPPAAGIVPPFLRDRNAAMIVPFIVFLLSGVTVSMAAVVPDLLYPLRVVAIATALLLFAPILRQISWVPDALAIAAGLLVGLTWIALSVTGNGGGILASELAALSAPALAAWIGFRLAGTILLVPLVEELFFRGYVLRRLDCGGAMRWVALIVSAALFAALHERWLTAAFAGIVFGLLMLRRNRLADPITAHVVANAVVAAWALANWNWSLI